MQLTERQQIGKRMKAWAKEKGLTSGEISARLGGVTDGAVRGWWRGQALPKAETLKSYARLVGRTLDALMASEHNHDEETLERVRRMVYLMRGGLTVERAAFLVFGKEGRIAAGDLDLIRSAIPAMLKSLDLQAEGAWDLASIDQQLTILDRAADPTSRDAP